MSNSYSSERKTCGTAIDGTISVAMEQRLNVLTAEKAMQKITETTRVLDLPKSSKFLNVCILQLDSGWYD